MEYPVDDDPLPDPEGSQHHADGRPAPSKPTRAVRVGSRRLDPARLNAVGQAGQGRKNMLSDILRRHAGDIRVFPHLRHSTLQGPLHIMDQLLCSQTDLTRGTGHKTVRSEVHKDDVTPHRRAEPASGRGGGAQRAHVVQRQRWNARRIRASLIKGVRGRIAARASIIQARCR
ncbi:hypothetical protein [Streptomyces sp. NPDC004008]